MASTLIPVATIATILNLTTTRVQQLAKDGVIPKASHGQYELIASVTSYIKYLQERVPGGGGSKMSADINDERARLLKAQADMAEIELAERSGSLVAVGRVESDWIQVLSACRSKLLGIPTKSAHQIINLVEIYEVEKFLKQMIHEALEELAAYEIKVEDISADETSKFGGSIGIGADSTNIGIIGPTAFYSDTAVRLTANGSDFTSGVIRTTMQYLQPRGPWAW